MICFYLSGSLKVVTFQTITRSVEKNIENCISNLKTDLVGGWFKINSLKANPNKFQLMNLGNRDKRSFDIRINSVQIKKLNELTLLGKN